MLLTEEQIKEIETMAELFFTLDQIAVNAEIDAEESQDIHDPHANAVILKSIDVAN